MKDKRCHKCGKFGHFQVACLVNKVSVKTKHGCAAEQILEGGFVAKANNLKPKPRFLYLEAEINGRNVSCLVGTRTMHSFISLKLVEELGSPTCRECKSINVRFAKGELHESKDVTLNVNFKCGMFEFEKNFTFCKMDEVEFNLEDTFFKTHTMDVRRKPIRLVLYCSGKEMIFWLTRIHMAGGCKLNLVLIDQMINEQMVVMLQMEQPQSTHGEAKFDGPPPKHIFKVLRIYTPMSCPKSYRQQVKSITKSK